MSDLMDDILPGLSFRFCAGEGGSKTHLSYSQVPAAALVISATSQPDRQHGINPQVKRRLS